MKWVFGVICLTASLAAVSATFCRTEEDCKEGFCCVGLTTSQLLNRGLCLRLARERRQCSEPDSKNDYFGGKFTRYCPCAAGLVCEPNKPGITDPEKRRKALRCQKPKETTTGPEVTTVSEIVTDGEIVDTTRGEIVTDPEIVTDDIVDETLPPEIVTDEETEAPEETEEPEVVETEEPEVVETEEPEEVVETEEPEEVVETEEPEEVVETEEPEEVVETEEPEEVVEPEEPEEVVEPEEPEEVVEEPETPEEAGQRGPGGERPRTDDPDCEDWTYGC